MSLGLRPIFKPKLKREKFESLGEALAENVEALDAIAEEAELEPFSAFADNREVPEDFDGDPEELDELLGRWNDWFDAEDGHSSIGALLAHIKQNDEAKDALEDGDAVINELEELARVLEIAAKQELEFRFMQS